MNAVEAADAAQIVQLRAQEGVRLGRCKPVIERKYGALAWRQLYGVITRSFASGIARAGLAERCNDPQREIARLKAVLRCEEAVCEDLDTICR